MNVTTVPIEQPSKTPTQPFFRGTMPVPPSVNMAYKLIHTKDSMRVGPTVYLKNFKDAVDAAFDRIDINDNQIVKLEAEKLVDMVEPRVEIEISCLLSRP